MKIVAIIQARVGSTRLPRKVLKDIEGKTMLARVVNRVRQAKVLHEVVVATTTQPADDAVIQECKSLNVAFFRGEEEDVLSRYYQAALQYNATAIVRVTSDCPLIDPGVINKVVLVFLDKKIDYTSNALTRSYPRGLDVEVMSKSALEVAWQKADKSYQRVHVTPYIYENPQLFTHFAITTNPDYSRYRWSVDTTEDLEFIRAVYTRLFDKESFSWKEVLAIIDKEPQLITLNNHVKQKALTEG